MGLHSITYTELFVKLVKMGHIKSVQLAPLRPPFPRQYNAHARCDYHAENPGHSTENCTALKYKVRDLINDGKLKFEDLYGPAKVKDLSRAKVEMMRQEKKTVNKVNFGKAAMPKEKVPIAKVRKSEAGSSSTIKGSKERSCKPNEEEEKKVLQDLVRNLVRILNEQNEYITTLRREHNDQTLKQRWTLESGDA